MEQKNNSWLFFFCFFHGVSCHFNCMNTHTQSLSQCQYTQVCFGGGGQRVWLPLQGHEWLCYLSHSWAVLTPAWARERRREWAKKRWSKMMRGGSSSSLQKIATVGGKMVEEGKRDDGKQSEGFRGEIESLWLSFRCSLLFRVKQLRSSFMAFGGGLMSSPTPPAVPHHAVNITTLLCSRFLLIEGWSTAGVPRQTRVNRRVSALFLHREQILLEIPWHFKF